MGEWLNNSLEAGINERDYWQMTIAEINRAIESKSRAKREEARERAQFDWVLADLIGRSIARLYSSSNNYPALADAYPSLFVEEKQAIEEKRNSISIIRFKQFAQFHNKKFEEAKND